MGILNEKGIFCQLDEQKLTSCKNLFSCGNKDLDDFFHSDCISYSNSLFGKSYCFCSTDNSNDIICAFTVSNSSIFTNRLPNSRKKKIGKEIPHSKQDINYPAVLIGRLGINIAYQHLHVGSELMNFIKMWFIEPNNKTGCRYLVVDAYNTEIPIAFYKKNGFDFIFSTETQEMEYRNIKSNQPLRPRLMYNDLIRLVK